MTHDEMVALIGRAVSEAGGTWADFGAGRGNFTRALRDLVGPSATLYAIDRDANALRANRDARTICADFTRPLDLPPLDGILMANALHWVRRQEAVLSLLAGYLRPGGRLLLVEYDLRWPRSYVPFPVPYARFESLARAAGLEAVQQVGERVSPSSGVGMYAALAFRRGIAGGGDTGRAIGRCTA
jgi:ubiquinone/menaquinone biosynthesis C-methylase UbiE